MANDDRDLRQTALTSFDHSGRVLADGGVAQLATDEFAATPPTYEQPYTEGDTPYEHYADAGKYGIMYAGFYQWDDVRCTAEAYGESRDEFGRRDTKPTRSLQFHTEWVDAETAKECIREIGGYNRFDPEYVTAAIDEMPDSAWFVVGRESSPVIYVWTDRSGEVMETFEESGSNAFDRQQELYDELSAIKEERDTDETLILKDPEDASGRLREVLAELERIDTFASGAPDELGAFPDAETFPRPRVEADDDPEPGTPSLVRAWWD
jgi:hypothetical protein